MLRKIDRIVLRVPAIGAAVAYYRDVLGLKLIRQDARIAIFQTPDGSTDLLLHTDPDLPAEATYWLVDDVRDLYRRRAAMKLTFTSAPQQVSRGYRAAVRDPFGTVLLLIDRTTEGAGAAVTEDAKAPGTLFAGAPANVPVKRAMLIKLYEGTGRTADDLPYTPHFETMYRDYAALHDDPKPTREEVWRHLLNLRKGGKLPKLGEARGKPPEMTQEDRDALRKALGDENRPP